jgi:2-phospho-L-lactate guanylyltransferase
MDLWAVVPMKSLSRAKERLAPVLAPHERRALAQAMLEDVLACLAALPALAGIAVATRDPAIGALARRYGARPIESEQGAGPNAAIGAAARVLAGEGAGGMLALPGDVPLATSEEVARLLAGHGPAPAVSLVPAAADRGTNALLCTPLDAIPLCFGRGSFARHHDAAARRGIAARILPLPGLGLDIDRPGDLLAFAARPSPTRSYALLAERAILERLLARRARGAAPAITMTS